MTLHVLHAGDGYTYLTRSVASGDRVREGRDQLSDYYLEGGTPPGRWYGRGRAALAESSATNGQVAGHVTEAQMKALFGEGLHPNADAMTADGEGADAMRLGRKFPTFTNRIPVLAAFNKAVAAHEQAHGVLPDKAARDGLWLAVSRTEFERENPNEPNASDKRVLSWSGQQKAKVRQPVAGYDLTFTPVKSVSVMWALADDDTRRTIEQIHRAAVDDAMSWIEDNAVFTRRGARSEQQINADGLTVAQFDHWDTRSGDPNLHTHCAVSNKVRGSDGRWSSLDGAVLHKMAVAASQRYNHVIADQLRESLGLEFVARETGRGKQPVMEIAGVGPALIDGFSTRRAQVRARHEQLVAEYVAQHGHTPGKQAEFRLFQQATLETREGKETGAQSLSEHMSTWRAKARTLAPEQAQGAQLLAHCQQAGRNVVAELTADDPRTWHGAGAAAEEVLFTVSEQRSHWRETHLRSTAEAVIAAKVLPEGTDRRQLVEDVVDRALAGSMRVGVEHVMLDEHTGQIPERLRRADGTHVLASHRDQLLTSDRVVAAEAKILGAATPTAHLATNTVIDAGIASVEENEPFPLNAGQAELVRHFCGSGALVAAGVGPAGTGKTTSMKATVAAWTAEANRLPGASENRQVIPLAPSAVAATKLGDEIELTGNTIDSFTHWWTANGGRETYLTARQVLADPDAAYAARRDARDALDKCPAGAMYLVDEAGMASTRNLAVMVDIAEQTGGVVRFLGDPYQLDAVTTGGAFAMLARATDAPELTDVVRFGTDTQQAENSLALRAGDQAALDLYEQRGWTHHHNTSGEAIDDMVAAHLADTASGKNSIVLASTREEVAAINAQIQAHHRSTGAARTARTVELSDGLTAGVGDRIVTRENDSDYRQVGGKRANSRVLNGDLWDVEKIHSDGSLTARHIEDGGRIHLPAGYLTANTELGYAATIHRAQGLTVTVCRALINPASANLRGLYVALTRGKAENHAYTATPIGVDEHTEGQHLLGAGDERSVDNSRAVLASVLARDDGHRAAIELIREAHHHATDPKVTRDAFNAARELLVTDYTDHLLGAHLPAAIVATIDADPAGKARIRSVVDQLVQAGATDIGARFNAVHDGLETARNLPAFIAYKINPPASAVAAQEHRAARELFIRDYTDHLLATHLPAAVVATIDADPDSKKSIERAVDRLHAAGATDIPARFADADNKLENFSPGASYTAHLLRSLRRPTHANEHADPSPAQISAHLHADPAGNAQLNAALTALAPLPDLTPEPDPLDLPALPPVHPGADRSLREHAHHAADSHDRATIIEPQLGTDSSDVDAVQQATPAAPVTAEQALAEGATLAAGLDSATLDAAANAVHAATRGPDNASEQQQHAPAADARTGGDAAAAGTGAAVDERKALAQRVVTEFKQHSIRRLPASELDFIAETGGRRYDDRLRELTHHTPREVAEHQASAERLTRYETSYADQQPYRDAITAHRKAIDALDTARTERDAVARELADTGRLSPRRRELARELDTRTAAVTAAEKAAEEARRTRSQEQARAGKHPVTEGALQAAREHTEHARAEAEKAQARQQAKIAELTATITARQQAARTEQERRSQLDPTTRGIEHKVRGAYADAARAHKRPATIGNTRFEREAARSTGRAPTQRPDPGRTRPPESGRER